MKTDIAFCSFAFGHGYYQSQIRLKESLNAIYDNPPLFFYSDSRKKQVGDNSLGDEPGAQNYVQWDSGFKHTGLPPGARRFCDSMYGFKPHLIQAALNAGYKKIAFLDPSIIVLKPIEFFDKFTETHSVIAFPDCALKTAISEPCKQYFHVDANWLSDKRLVGGSFYYFNFNYESCEAIFSKWKKAEEDGIFGSQMEASTGRIAGHRCDESALSVILYQSGVGPLLYEADFSQILIKKHHFKC